MLLPWTRLRAELTLEPETFLRRKASRNPINVNNQLVGFLERLAASDDRGSCPI